MNDEGFGPGNLPYGVDDEGHVLVAWRDEVLDLVHAEGLDVGRDVWASGSLNAFFDLGPAAWATTRSQLRAVAARQPARARRRRAGVRLVRPFDVGDVADFYASREHATNMATMLRPGQDPLPEAWLHLPIGYHGRAGTVIVSGCDVARPAGVLRAGEVGPTSRLDVEVEIGFVVGTTVPRGRSVSAAEADRHIFGVVLVNDWSARDIQSFEYRPLGPFLGKSFATSVSPWVVPLAALDPWRVPGPRQDPAPVGYLRQPEPRGLDVRLRLEVNGTPLSTVSSAGLYWSAAQQLAHLTANGAGVRAGDLFASGTISGAERGSEGSLMELTGNGAQPVVLADGSRRSWVADGDTVTIRGWCEPRGGAPGLSLGEVSSTVVPCGGEVLCR